MRRPMLAREDSNRDSQVSLVEHRAATLANFDRLDTDKDGMVTAAEMKAGGHCAALVSALNQCLDDLFGRFLGAELASCRSAARAVPAPHRGCRCR